MISRLKGKIEQILGRKEVSLAMLVDRRGRILWHSGRAIRGKTLDDGEGFSKTALRRAMDAAAATRQDDVIVTSAADELSRSARMLCVKSLLVLPVAADLFLYIDSGVRESFSPADREVFHTIGELMHDAIISLEAGESGGGGLSGSSAPIRQARELAVRYALENETVLLAGETGVGKNRAAEWIHRLSGRRGPFVAVHMPSIPESLLESELFGHRRGAFTGASDSRRGLIEAAEGGTLFFDEIADMPPAFQAKLLGFLDTRRYRSLGDAGEREADVRLIAASNRDLREEVRARRFREDLFFRLNVLPLRIPPLRERREDIRVLVAENLPLLRDKGPGPGFWEALEAHDWPGNVRELVHVLILAGIQCDPPLRGLAVEAIIRAQSTAAARPAAGLAGIEADIANGATFWDTAWKAFLGRDLGRDELKSWLAACFERSGGSLKKTALSLNIDESEYARFISILHRYRLHPKK